MPENVTAHKLAQDTSESHDRHHTWRLLHQVIMSKVFAKSLAFERVNENARLKVDKLNLILIYILYTLCLLYRFKHSSITQR